MSRHSIRGTLYANVSRRLRLHRPANRLFLRGGFRLSETSHQISARTPRGRYLVTLSLGALGVVYGDIGTSPLYAVRECFSGTHRIPATHANVYGILSLIFWSLIIIISVKYVAFVMRADNRGEGGILSLMALMPHRAAKSRAFLVALGLFGAALLYGDGMITPAISVLSAVEGLEVATPMFDPFIIPMTIVILIALFFFQKYGTGGVGAVFGPIMLLWFVTIAGFGIYRIIDHPQVLYALNPADGIRFFANNGWRGFLVLGAVFLAVTGGEALYADMGHFGTKPIRITWFVLVLPSLVLNYFGQGALLLVDPGAAENPFYLAAPEWALYPLVVLSTAATVIASQAVISGAFSLTRQAVQLGYSPRVDITHTSAREIGQIYVPGINWTLMIATIGLVLGFRSSSALANAYGVAVTTTMVITTLLLFIVARELWKWPLIPLLLLTAAFLTIDLSFFLANIIKVEQGGWFPLLVAAIIFMLMATWRRGRIVLGERLRESILPLDLFLADVERRNMTRVPGTAIFMSRATNGTPPALLHNIKHNKIIHERVVILTVQTEDIPHVPEEERFSVTSRGSGFFQVVIRFGFMEDPNIPEVLAMIDSQGLKFRPEDTSYFLGRETLIATKRPGMALWRERIFAWMARNSTSATRFFSIPTNRVVELGAQVEL